MATAYLNCIETALPPYDVHQKFVEYVPLLMAEDQSRNLFKRMASRVQIEHRYSFLEPSPDVNALDTQGFYRTDDFPDTQTRMQFYEAHAFSLAKKALDGLDLDGITHVLITTCTGFYAPGLDLQIVEHYDLPADTERTVIGFMGCYAALNALKLARHIVRSDNDARVAIVNLELCTLHLKQEGTLEEMLSFLIFADGCAASIVSSEPQGMSLDRFHTAIIPDSERQITWHIGGLGFDMHLSGRVPATISSGLPSRLQDILGSQTRERISHWAIHPGGRSVLDAVRDSAGLEENQLRVSRDILRRYGNMSSTTIMFVLEHMIETAQKGEKGCAMAFGPGVTVESMCFTVAGS